MFRYLVNNDYKNIVSFKNGIILKSKYFEIFILFISSVYAINIPLWASLPVNVALVFIYFIAIYRYLFIGYYVAASVFFIVNLMYLYSLLIILNWEYAYVWLSEEGNLSTNYMVDSAMKTSLDIHVLFLISYFIIISFLPKKSNRHFFKGSSGFDHTNVILFILFISFLVGILNPRPPLVFGIGYHSDEYVRMLDSQGKNIAGMEVFMVGLLTMALYLVFIQHFGRKGFFGWFSLIFAQMSYFTLLRGTRSGAVVFICNYVIFYLIYSKNKYKYIIVLLLLFFGFFLMQFWAQFRWNAGFYPIFEAIRISFYKLFDPGENEFHASMFLYTIERLPQLFWNILIIDSLVEQDIYLNGSSFFNFIGQSVPSFLADIIGYERPRDSAWILADYVDHGGGIYNIAEAYWNFGLPGVLIWGVIMGFIIYSIEKHFNNYLAGTVDKKNIYKSLTYYLCIGISVTFIGSMNTTFKYLQLILILLLSMSYLVDAIFVRNKLIKSYNSSS